MESGVLRALGRAVPSLSTHLRAIAHRLIDLKEGIQKFVYHPEFHASFSIKDVLPALIPDMSYASLGVRDGARGVRDGAGAQLAFRRLQEPSLSEAERARLIGSLLNYCRHDTLAMVRLHEFLERSVDPRGHSHQMTTETHD